VPQTKQVAAARIQDRPCFHPPLESDAREEKRQKLKVESDKQEGVCRA